MTANVMFDIHIPSDDIFLAEIHCGDIPFSDIYVLCQFHLYLHPFINKIFVHKGTRRLEILSHLLTVMLWSILGVPRFIALVCFITSKKNFQHKFENKTIVCCIEHLLRDCKMAFFY
jgi:hypothetical protein